MKRMIAMIMLLMLLSGCQNPAAQEGAEKQMSYRQIGVEEAKQMMDAQAYDVILDVREPDEYAGGHIPGATLLPLGTIDADSAADAIPDKDSVVLVYCRSGRRSKTAAAQLAELGYGSIYEFGGIIDWPYAVE